MHWWLSCTGDGKLNGHTQPDGIDSPGGENQDGCCCADNTKTSYTQDDIKVPPPLQCPQLQAPGCLLAFSEHFLLLASCSTAALQDALDALQVAALLLTSQSSRVACNQLLHIIVCICCDHAL